MHRENDTEFAASGPVAGCLTLFDPNFDLSRSTDRQYFVLDAAHTYAAPGTYYGRVSVSDGGAVDSETFVMTIPTAPAVPTGLQATPAPQDGLDEGQVRLVWDQPGNNGAAITDYVIESSADGTTWTAVDDGVSTATTSIVTGLTNGTNYRFRVAARNAIGVGPSSTPVEATPAWMPAAQAGVTPADGVGSGQVKLTWTAPADHGAAITDYVIESSLDGTVWTTVDDGVSTSTAYTVSGLTNGTRYSFRVAAKNAAGVGPSSTPVEATPVGLPNAPGGLTAVVPIVGLGFLARLTWNAPVDNGSAVTDYVIQTSLDGTTWTTVDDGVSTATTYTVNGLLNALRYSFRVAAKNAVGTGPWSPAVKGTLVLY